MSTRIIPLGDFCEEPGAQPMKGHVTVFAAHNNPRTGTIRGQARHMLLASEDRLNAIEG